MKIYLDCVPCFLRQALESVRMSTDDEAIHEQVLREVSLATAKSDMRGSPPEMGQRIHRIIRELTGNRDPYRQAKERFNRLALELRPGLEELVKRSASPMDTAVRLAIAGNIIDCGVKGDLDESHVLQTIRGALDEPLDGDMTEFVDVVSAAEDILYLADNSGEIVLDRLLIELLPAGKVTVAVRGAPIINDATTEDAREAGLFDLAEVIDNGSDAPGTILRDCSEDFQRRFKRADIVIAKGQGNYETLSEADQDIFFLLKAKCPVIARDIGCELGSMVLRRGGARVAAGKTDTRDAGL